MSALSTNKVTPEELESRISETEREVIDSLAALDSKTASLAHTDPIRIELANLRELLTTLWAMRSLAMRVKAASDASTTSA